ncbi:hypothetical protein DSLASN_45730 [Desulfoluna limicola]|uniref:Uncharacterized protein n=2 Tax=Desulfoluna limicola TaxID=2810562 RepID=A0ABM7PN29_9BACT|nr:hypothetical protein DSLASN_45730 [Desulfoluna limicola]
MVEDNAARQTKVILIQLVKKQFMPQFQGETLAGVSYPFSNTGGNHLIFGGIYWCGWSEADFRRLHDPVRA